MQARKPSRYQAIWDTLKKEGSLKLLVEPQHYATLKKAVVKRKDVDVAFKHMLSEEGCTARLVFSFKGKIASISLVKSLSISDIL